MPSASDTAVGGVGRRGFDGFVGHRLRMAMTRRRAWHAAAFLLLASLLTGCFSSSTSFVGTGTGTVRPRGAAVRGRLVVNIDADLPAVSTAPGSLPPVRSAAAPPAPFSGREGGARFSRVHNGGPGGRRQAAGGGGDGADSGMRYWLLAQDDAVPDDPRLAEQWNLHLIRAPQGWATLARQRPFMSRVPVAIVDTRICRDHVDLLPGPWRGFDALGDGVDALSCPPGPGDYAAQHGTMVAGIVAAHTNNGRGIAAATWVPGGGGGTSPVEPLAVRVLDDAGRGSIEHITQGIAWAVEQGGARVVNLSLGFPYDPAEPAHMEERDKLFAELDRHAGRALFVAAAGNDGGPRLASPADHPDVLAVGATDPRGRKAEYSNEGDVDLVAPGGAWAPVTAGVLSTMGESGYGYLAGTSMAAPHVAAAAALLMAAGVERPDEVAAVLKFTARSIRDPESGAVYYDKSSGRSPAYGWGMLDVAGALRMKVMPVVFLARVTPDAVHAVSDMVWPAPDGAFSVSRDAAFGDAADEVDELYVVAWADSDMDGHVSEGDFYGALPVNLSGGDVYVGELHADPYRGGRRSVHRR